MGLAILTLLLGCCAMRSRRGYVRSHPLSSLCQKLIIRTEEELLHRLNHLSLTLIYPLYLKGFEDSQIDTRYSGIFLYYNANILLVTRFQTTRLLL
jgi:hypothetical protein